MTQFFRLPSQLRRRRSQHREVADNDYSTYTDQTSFLLHIDSNGDGTGTARAFTDIFIKTTGVASYSAAFTDPQHIASPATRTLPGEVVNDSGDTVPTTVDGYQHDLHNLWEDETQRETESEVYHVDLHRGKRAVGSCL